MVNGINFVREFFKEEIEMWLDNYSIDIDSITDDEKENIVDKLMGDDGLWEVIDEKVSSRVNKLLEKKGMINND